MTTQQIAAFQGVLPVPMFKAPYTIPVNNGGVSFLMTCCSQMPMGNRGRTDNTNSVIYTADAYSLTYTGASHLTVGGGYNAATGTSSDAPLPINFGFSYVTTISNAILNSANSVKGVSFNVTPFTGNRQVGPLTWVSSLTATGLFGTNFTAQYHSFVAKVVVNTVALACVGSVMVYNDLTQPMYLFYAAPLLPAVNGYNRMPTFGRTYAQLQQMYSLSQIVWDTSNTRNVLFSVTTTPVVGIYGFKFNFSYGGSDVLPASDELQLLTDNAAINALINTNLINFYACANGWLLATAHADYYFNADASKYWQLIFQQEGTGIAVPQGYSNDDKPNGQGVTKFVDLNGSFWYTGSAAQSGGNVTPYFSLGFNISYGVFSLNFPPVHMPCYDACLGTDWPMTKVYRTK